MKAFLLPIGSDRRLVTVANPGFRTGRQAATVRRLLDTGRVAFALCDPFAVTRDVVKPRRPRSFWFSYAGPDMKLRSARVSLTGRVLREVPL